MTRVGVFWLARRLKADLSADVQGLPVLRVDLLIKGMVLECSAPPNLKLDSQTAFWDKRGL